MACQIWLVYYNSNNKVNEEDVFELAVGDGSRMGTGTGTGGREFWDGGV